MGMQRDREPTLAAEAAPGTVLSVAARALHRGLPPASSDAELWRQTGQNSDASLVATREPVKGRRIDHRLVVG